MLDGGELRQVTPIALHTSTGNLRTDRMLQGIIGLCELAFPDRIHSYYLTGSYADGSAVPASDIDMYVLFKDDFRSRYEERQAWQIDTNCELLLSKRLDIVPWSAARVIHYGITEVKQVSLFKIGSVFLYGTDIREEIVLPPLEQYVRAAMHDPLRLMARLRQNANHLTFPLTYPDAEAPFYGYDRPMYTGEAVDPVGTEDLMLLLTRIAAAVLALEAGQYVRNKHDTIRAYRVHINDQWTALLEEVNEYCRMQWHYRIPTEETDRRRLRNLCQQIVAFENAFLTHYKAFLLAELCHPAYPPVWLPVNQAASLLDCSVRTLHRWVQQGRVQEQRMRGERWVLVEDFPQLYAASMARQVWYTDDEVRDALRQLEATGSALLRRSMQATLRRLQRNDADV